MTTHQATTSRRGEIVSVALAAAIARDLAIVLAAIVYVIETL